MRRVLLPVVLTVSLAGQTGRDAYRQAYDTWRQAQANLEADAATGSAAQVAQADRSAAAAASFQATRLAYFKSSIENATQRRQILQSPAIRSSPGLMPPSVAGIAATELQSVTRAIAKFATDQDRGIQQLRQSMERERVALAALTETIQARQKAVAATSAAAEALEKARIRAADAFRDQGSQLSNTVSQMESEGPAWAAYYDKLAEAIQNVNAPPAAVPSPATVSSSVTPAAAPADTPAISSNANSPLLRNTSISPVPLVRYVGEWMYPKLNGVFHGIQPDSVELEVHEKDGHAGGTIEAKFKPSPGGPGDSSIKFTFEGDIAATPTQRFPLTTSDGTSGTIELIPGPAFNLLEVVFQTDAPANKIRIANFILVKK
jgi:hypothetical protein